MRANNLNRMTHGDAGRRKQEKLEIATVKSEEKERERESLAASTFDREFRSPVASEACTVDRGTEDRFVGGISATGSASWIASCPAARVRFSANVAE